MPTCRDCDGDGYLMKDGDCSECKGRGEVWDYITGGRLGVINVRRCPTCEGERTVTKKETCSRCSGEGRVPDYRECWNCYTSGYVVLGDHHAKDEEGRLLPEYIEKYKEKCPECNGSGKIPYY